MSIVELRSTRQVSPVVSKTDKNYFLAKRRMSSSISVQDVLYTRIVKTIDISDVKVTLFQGADISIILRDASGNYISNQTLHMTQSDYLNWQNDDVVLQNWILTQLGMVRAS
jgi:hypothetical protein